MVHKIVRRSYFYHDFVVFEGMAVRLSSIKLSGFKSFADTTNIVVSKSLVAVLGPNGCGKSNVIDAVRWVLGESSARQLRGESMQDVIFNGSGTRHPASRAAVELVFDNAAGSLGGVWGRFAEISIKRMLTRSGESTYWINGQQVRRRDIADLFLGTGVGARGYAVIEQGMISRIIEARPEELRAHLEEAAGVSRYRERRRETEHRLDDAGEHLERLADLQNELDAQIEKLELQAQAAQHYQQLQTTLAEKQDFLALLRKQEAQHQEATARANLANLQTEAEAILAKMSAGKQRLAVLRDDFVVNNQAIEKQQAAAALALQNQARLEAELRFVRDRALRLERDVLQLKAKLAEEYAIKNQAVVDYDEALEALEDARLQREELRLLRDNQEDLQAAEAAFLSAAAMFERAQQEAQMVAQDLALSEQKNEQNQKLEERLRASLSRIDQALAQLDDDHEAAGIFEAREMAVLACETAAIMLEQAQSDFDQATQELEASREHLQNLQQNETMQRAHWEAARALLPKDEHDLARFWQQHHGTPPPELWTMLRVAPDWEAAFSVVLGEQMRAFCVENASFLNDVGVENLAALSFWQAQELEHGAEHFSGGHFSEHVQQHDFSSLFPDFSPLFADFDAQLAQEILEKLPRLSAFASLRDARFAPVLQAQLAGVLTVPSVDILRKLAPFLAAHHRLVAPSGELAFFGGRRFAGEAMKSPLFWQARLEQLSAELELLAPQITAANYHTTQAKNTFTQAKNALVQAQNTFKQQEKAATQANINAEKMQTKLQVNHVQKARLIQEKQSINQELAGITSAEKNDSVDLRTKATALDAQAMTLKKQKLDAETRFKLAQNRQQAEQLALQEAGFACTQAEDRLQNLRQRIDAAEDHLLQWQEQLEHLQLEYEENHSTELEQKLQTAIENSNIQQEKLTQIRDSTHDIEAKMRQIEVDQQQLEQAREHNRDTMQTFELQAQEARLTVERFSEALAQADEVAILAKMPANLQPQQLAQDIAQLARQLQSFSAVNLAALDELAAAKERKNYLQAQVADVQNAISLLQNAIENMDAETRMRLQTTFDAVNQAMARMFPRLFGGGEAELRLTDDDILHAGMQIMARPPGKKNASIHLLSGGEKALTAMSLVFALFSLNPAPFCLLDEVDAPLDDANTGRFCDLVRDMAQQTQFLYISHNRLTMEMADQLVGVTMQEKGVSRVVEVDLHTALDWREQA